MTSPEQLWSLFAHQVAGQAKVRISRDAGRSYGRAQHLPASRPELPAAVLTYDGAGATSCLSLDFDVKARGGVAQAIADARAFVELVRAAGGDVVVDRSPSGGQHVYVPLQRPRPLEQVRAVMIGLAGRFTTLDRTPMSNAASGAIRPPGAAHPRGGHQTLVTPLDDALEVFQVRNSDEVWTRLCEALGPVDHVPLNQGGLGHRTLDAPNAHRPGGRVSLPALYEDMARTGIYDGQRYDSTSEARQAVLSSAYLRGWTLREVAEQIDTGRWAGLAGFFAQYRGRRAVALRSDWNKAADWAERRSRASGIHTSKPGHAPRTGEALTEDRYLRAWWTAMRATEVTRYADRPGQSTRLVLRALIALAHRNRSRYVKVGVRSLALGSTLDHSTVAKVLRRLRDEHDPLLVLIDGERGHGNADIYELRIPDAHAQLAERRRWRPGGFEPIHPAFRELGVPAALVYDALGESREPIESVQAVAAAALIGRDAAGDALRTLVSYGLVEQGATGYRRGPASLAAVADLLGALEWQQERVETYRAQRRQYRERLGVLALERAERDVTAPAADPIDMWATGMREPDLVDAGEHVEDLVHDVIDLVARELGAVLVPT